MKTFSRLFTAIAAFVALALAPATFGQNAPQPEVRPVIYAGGLTLQLTTSSYKVVQPRAAAAGAVAANVLPQRDAITASALLANRSNSAITFTFPDGASAAAKFEFVLNDKDGNEVWRSDEGIGTEAITEVTLKRGAVWRRVVRVPLIIEGTPIAVGNYTLLAFTDSDKQVLAQTLLEVVAPPSVPAKGKINGAVVKVIKPATDVDPEVTEPAAGAWVTVQQLLTAPNPGGALFAWSGSADDAGKFAVEVPAGRFRVTAGEKFGGPILAGAGANVILPPNYPPQSVEVNVAAGATVDVLIKLTKAPTPVVQGIKGLVVKVQPDPAAGVAAELPVAGARVEVTEILSGPEAAADANGVIIRVPFRWTGLTNNEGRFEARTPAGRFHVVATNTVFVIPNVPVVQVQVAADGSPVGNGLNIPIPPGGGIIRPPDVILTASADVAVEAGKFSDLKLTLKPVNVPVPQPMLR